MKRSNISWTDYSGGCLNFVLRGKAKGDCEVSPGCAHCYAWILRNRNPQAASDQTTYSEDKLRQLAKWKPEVEGNRRGPGSRPMAFVVDMGDLFHHLVPDEFIKKAVEVMAGRPDVDFQILTKRPERMAVLFSSVPDNVWIGATVENQEAADRRIPHLQKINASVRFLSVEPMLEPVHSDLAGIHWVICGGESGGNRRPFKKQWAHDLRDDCRRAGAAFYFKQGSHRHPGRDDDLDGEIIKEWPRGGVQ